MFTTVPASPFVDNASTLAASTVNQWRAFFPQALDAIGGGAYGPVNPITISAGGATWTFQNPVRFDATGSVAFGAGVTATVESTARITVASGGELRIDSGGSLLAQSGSTVGLNGSSYVGGGATLTIGPGGGYGSGNLSIGASGSLVVLPGGTVNLSGAMTHANGATITHASGSAEIHQSGSNDTYQSGSSLTCNSGANVLFNSAITCNSGVNLNGNTVLDSAVAFLQQGAHIKSGTSAYTSKRAPHTASASGETIDISEYDLVKIPINLISGTVYYDLTAPAGVRCSCQFYATAATIADQAAVAAIRHGGIVFATISYDMTYAFGSVIVTYDGTTMIPHVGRGASDGS